MRGVNDVAVMQINGLVTVRGIVRCGDAVHLLATSDAGPTTAVVHLSSTEFLATFDDGDEFELTLNLKRPRHAAGSAAGG